MNPEPSRGPSLRGQVAAWLLRLEESPDDMALRAEFEAWLAQSQAHRNAYETMTRLWQTAEELGAVVPAPLPTKTVQPASRKRGVPRFAWGMAAVAACLAFLALPAIKLHLAADYATSVAELREVTLEDGSRVSLDAASAIAVDFKGPQRRVKLLSGQAFFEVVPSAARPFVVDASDVKVMVTGTAFSVGVSETGVAVEVETGTVNVIREGRQLAGLTVGQRVHVAPDGTKSTREINPDDVAAWRDSRLVVYQATIGDVVEQIGRYMPGVIVFRDREIADRLVTGIINLRRPDEALRAVVEMQKGKVSSISPYLAVISSR